MSEYKDGEPKSFEELMADKVLGLFLHKVLLKKNLEPLTKFVDQRSKFTRLDPLEIPQLKGLLGDPITSPVHEVSQWRFNDKPFMFLFKGWRVNEFPTPNTERMWNIVESIQHAFREYDAEGVTNIPMSMLQELIEELSDTYDEVAEEIDPNLKKVWVENEIKRYEEFEGQTENLPGRLTPEYVTARLAEMRGYREKLLNEPGGMQAQTLRIIPSSN